MRLSLFLIVALTACGNPPQPEAQPETSANPVIEGTDPGVLFDRGRVPVVTGWEDQPEKLTAAYCQDCHQDSHAQWSEGLHAQAWTDPVFVEAFHKEELLWCVNCHAPLASQVDAYLAAKEGREHPATPLLAEGINCAACHVRDGRILGARDNTNNAHPVETIPFLGQSEFCADCHQFNFPRFEHGKPHEIRYTEESMQNTYGEWLEYANNIECKSCHYSEHRLKGPHDRAWMAGKFKGVTYRVEDGVLLRVAFKVAARGHLTPSGDLFHSLVLEVSQAPDFARLFSQHKWARFYRKGFYEPGVLWDRVLVANNGLRPDERNVAVTLDMPSDGPTWARLVYYYHDHHLGGRFEGGPELQYLVLWEDQVR